MQIRVDWSRRADYVRARHGVEPAWADQVLADDHAVWLTPDPASRSGLSVRVIGYSPAAGAVLTVILLESDADPDEKPDGTWWGVNAWTANDADRNLYTQEGRP